MKYPEDKNILNFIISNNDICEIIRDDLDTIEGTPIKYNKEFILIAYNYDFEFDGYKIVMFKDINNIKYDEVDIFISAILKKENIAPKIKKVLSLKIDNFEIIFKYFYNKKENIIIECERNSEFNIGRILKIYDDHIMFLNFNGEGTWDKDPLDIYYEDITLISFRNRYVKYMSKYVHN